ncbi:hypothetical protein PRIPAC_98069 [Pristionchus pacificus]|uniref:Uncharacterized protein n=1 Tax=Pristionchus pacificus TaxID=54126 RepID=A0A2A6BDW0_PRIPA|nr:hypothetical protein PRIPAC_98069 [Pristionchus pacificus]|eukprot:PDM64001.1 hypothetical protein PRIPAC_49502 [Pristionchus pacificus]
MPWIVATMADFLNAFNCFRCGTESTYKCYTDKCTLTPTVHRYCQRCAHFYLTVKLRAAGDTCLGCAPRLWKEQAKRDQASSVAAGNSTVNVDEDGRPISDEKTKEKKE